MVKATSSILIKANILETFLMTNRMAMDFYNTSHNIILVIFRMEVCKATDFGKTKKAKNM